MAAEDSKPPAPPYAGHDGLLEMWVVLAQKADVQIPVTLMVGGTLVAGHIIGSSAYLRRLAEDLRTGFESGGAKEAGDRVYRGMLEIAEHQEAEAKEEKEEEEEEEPRRYIHLRDVNVFLAPDVRPIRFEHWRGRLDSVDGWFLGKAEFSP